jgi:hypothetical protein
MIHLPFVEETLNLDKQIAKGGALGGHDRVLDMLVMGKALNLRLMRGVVVTENHRACGILPVVAITEPGEGRFLNYEGLADLKEGIVRQSQPDAEVSPGSRKDFCAILLNLGAWEPLDGLTNLPEVPLE